MVKKTGQYQIQQMAFMILAIFFFFVLVGLFFAGWQYSNMKRGFFESQEKKAMSALKTISDSTELNCKDNTPWCIDKDKLIAFSESSHLYQNYFSVASIEVLIVYPFRNNLFFESDSPKLQKQIIDCPGDYGDKTGDGFNNRPIYSASVIYSFTANQGPINHLPPNGDALRPKLLFDNLNIGQKIQFQGISGEIDFKESKINCKDISSSSYGSVVGGFYSSDDQLINEYDLIDFENPEGISVPDGAKYLYVYPKESDEFKESYSENTGMCSFSVKKLGWETCYASSSGQSSPMYNQDELILCPAPDCNYYILFDSGQRDKLTFSTYVNVCQTIDLSYEKCELAKLMLGVKISE
jgi:hypothetical protein